MAVLFLFIVHDGYRGDLWRGFPDRTKTDHPVALPGADKEGALRVAVMMDGAIFFRNERILWSRLTPAIRIALVYGPERHVYIDADRRAKYGTVSQVVDAVRAAGVDKISFLTQQPVPPESSQ